MLRVLIAGDGLSGAVFARQLVAAWQEQVQISVWERDACGMGGRMRTTAPTIGSSEEQRHRGVDMGAQYISLTSAADTLPDFFRQLLQIGEAGEDTAVLRHMEGEEVAEADVFRVGGVDATRHVAAVGGHYVAPQGMGAVVDAVRAGCVDTLIYGRELREICAPYPGQKGAWLARHVGGNGDHEDAGDGGDGDDDADNCFDLVVLTQPLPEVLAVDGVAGDGAFAAEVTAMQALRYSSRFALAAVFAPGALPPLDSMPFHAAYVDGMSALRYWSVENAKQMTSARGPASGAASPVSVLLHSSAPFAANNADLSEEEATQMLLADFQVCMGQDTPLTPLSTDLHYWRYSQCMPGSNETLLGITGGQPFLCNARNNLLVIGDAFVSSNFEGCVASATAAAEHIVQVLR